MEGLAALTRDPNHPQPSLTRPAFGGRCAASAALALGKLPMLALALVWCLGLVLPAAGPDAAAGRSFNVVHHKVVTTLPPSALDRTAAAAGRARLGVSGVIESAGASPDSEVLAGPISISAAALLCPPTNPIAPHRGAPIPWPNLPAIANRCDLRTAGRAPPRA